MGSIERVGIVARPGLTAASAVLAEIAGWLEARGVRALFETETGRLAGVPPDRPVSDGDELPGQVDLVLALGGDGTLLAMADRVAKAGAATPILGVNFGSLGFLTEVTLPELYPSLESTLAGTARIEHRLMLRVVTRRDGQVLSDRPVLNDVVVTRGSLSRIIDLSVWVGEHFVSQFRSDGLIVASPTGSTAYNLASGGPILSPEVDAIVLTPIAPHTLTHRPLVIPASAEVRIQPLLDGRPQEVFVTFDGQFGFAVEPHDAICVRRAEQPLRLVRASPRSYFEVLREKLKWGAIAP